MDDCESMQIKDLELSNDQNTLTVCTAKQVSFLDPATMQVTAAHSVDVELNSVSLAPNKSKFVAVRTRTTLHAQLAKDT